MTAALALSVPSVPAFPWANHGREAVHKNTRATERNIHPVAKPKIYELSARESAEICSLVVRGHYSQHASPIKQFARDVEINEHTARNIYEGRNAPNFLTTLKMIAAIPAFAAEARRLAGMEANLDPGFNEALNRVMQEFTKMQAQTK